VDSGERKTGRCDRDKSPFRVAPFFHTVSAPIQNPEFDPPPPSRFRVIRHDSETSTHAQIVRTTNPSAGLEQAGT
jgi:hypothetical protein